MFLGPRFGIVSRAPGIQSLWRVLINRGTLRSEFSLVTRAFTIPSWARDDEVQRPWHTEALLPSRCSTRAAFSNTAAPASASAAGDAASEGVTFTTTEVAQRRNADEGCTAFVTGANRGIGLEVTRQLLERTKGAAATNYKKTVLVRVYVENKSTVVWYRTCTVCTKIIFTQIQYVPN